MTVEVTLPEHVEECLRAEIDVLWIGAFERLASAGITRMAGIHRGFSVYEHGPYRNDPGWKLAMEMRALLPDIAMLCDPSHIAGRADLVPIIAQEALNLSRLGGRCFSGCSR